MKQTECHFILSPYLLNCLCCISQCLPLCYVDYMKKRTGLPFTVPSRANLANYGHGVQLFIGEVGLGGGLRKETFRLRYGNSNRDCAVDKQGDIWVFCLLFVATIYFTGRTGKTAVRPVGGCSPSDGCVCRRMGGVHGFAWCLGLGFVCCLLLVATCCYLPHRLDGKDSRPTGRMK